MTGAIRPELVVLTDEQKRRVLEQVSRRRGSCRHCGGETFAVGDALYLGFLFLSEDTDTYMAALSCTNPACSAPHTGIKLLEREFLSPPTARRHSAPNGDQQGSCDRHSAPNGGCAAS